MHKRLRLKLTKEEYKLSLKKKRKEVIKSLSALAIEILVRQPK